MQVFTLNREYDIAWSLVPYFCARIREFEETYNASGGVSGLWKLFRQAFAAGDERMLGIAIFDTSSKETPKLAGHLVAGTDLHHGEVACVIYQYEKDIAEANGTARRLNSEIQAIVDEWVRKLGQTEVSALAISEARAKHFKHWGYEYRSSLVTRRIGYGRQGQATDIEHGSDDPPVAGGCVQAITDWRNPEHGGLHAGGAERTEG